MKNKRLKAFTLIEMLLVVIILAILTAIVIIALNPSKQLSDTNNTRRVSDIRTINDALYQYSIDHNGNFPEGVDETPKMLGTESSGCNLYIDDKTGETDEECLDVKEYIAPVYIADIPYDPVVGSKEKTYYAVFKENERLKVISIKPESEDGNDSNNNNEEESVCYNATQNWANSNLDVDDGLGGIMPYGNNESNVTKYGYLYTWEAAVRVAGNISGWKLPSDEEFKQLERDLGMSEVEVNATGYRGTNEGSKISGRGELWVDGPIEADSDFACSGIDFVPGGLKDSYGWTWVDGRNARYWTSTEIDTNNVWDRYLFYGNTSISRRSSGKTAYYSVRLIQE